MYPCKRCGSDPVLIMIQAWCGARVGYKCSKCSDYNPPLCPSIEVAIKIWDRMNKCCNEDNETNHENTN